MYTLVVWIGLILLIFSIVQLRKAKKIGNSTKFQKIGIIASIIIMIFAVEFLAPSSEEDKKNLAKEEDNVKVTEVTKATEAKEAKPEVKITTPTEPADEKEYREGVINTSTRMSSILTEFSNYLSANADKLGTNEYNSEVSRLCGDLNSVLTDIRKLEAPSKYANVHGDYLEATNLYQTVADGLPAAVRNLDTDKIYELSDNMNKASSFVTSATTKLREIMQ